LDVEEMTDAHRHLLRLSVLSVRSSRGHRLAHVICRRVAVARPNDTLVLGSVNATERRIGRHRWHTDVAPTGGASTPTGIFRKGVEAIGRLAVATHRPRRRAQSRVAGVRPISPGEAHPRRCSSAWAAPGIAGRPRPGNHRGSQPRRARRGPYLTPHWELPPTVLAPPGPACSAWPGRAAWRPRRPRSHGPRDTKSWASTPPECLSCRATAWRRGSGRRCHRWDRAISASRSRAASLCDDDPPGGGPSAAGNLARRQ
jgi:hypothetical protein